MAAARIEVQHFCGEPRTEVFVHADAAPLRGGLLAAKMRGGLAWIAGAFEGEVEFDVVFEIEILPLGVEPLNIVRRHRSGLAHDLKLQTAPLARTIQFNKENRLPAAEHHIAAGHRNAFG